MQYRRSCLFALILVASFPLAATLLADSDHCAICGALLGDTIYTVTDKVTHEKLHICYECSVWPDDCFICGLPVRKGFIKLSDGRFICGRDAKTAVLDDDEAKRICGEVKDTLDRIFSRFLTFPGTNVDVAIVDRVDLLALFKIPGNDYECPNVLGYFESKTNESQVQYKIRLMSALPRVELRAVCAHEYSHAWVAANVSPERKKTLGRSAEEGFCELVAYLLMDSQHEEEGKKEITRNNYTRGQIDLFIEAEKRYGFNEIADWMKYGVDAQLDKNDLNKVRQIEIPRPKPRPLPNVILNATTPAPEPDTLVLRGISWIKNQPLALINDQTFAAGESGKVRIGKTNVFIHCLSIRDNVVRIQIADSGEERELRLKPDNR